MAISFPATAAGVVLNFFLAGVILLVVVARATSVVDAVKVGRGLRLLRGVVKVENPVRK